ncbi:MAG: zf-HC2 domain-containing protein [Gemmatimonadetes bacterium]|nr:zf-HC2 domain-containing protein [Gemmatimonadota bacterium]
MAQKHPKTHLTAERIQAFLDDALSRDDRAEIQEHATSCGRCQAELETWQLLYSELGGLPELSPAPNFRERVLAGLDTAVAGEQRLPVSAEQRLFGWLRKRAVRAAEHLGPERLQDYVEGLLPERQMARVSAHLEACEDCHGEEEQWRSLIHGIEKLPVMAPSSAFASHVMGQIRIGRLMRPAAASTARGFALARAWAGRLVPRTQKAWAVISGIALTPFTVGALLAYAVFSNPLVTPGALASFLWWRISDGANAVWGLLADGLVESPIAFYAYSALDFVAGGDRDGGRLFRRRHEPGRMGTLSESNDHPHGG